MNLSSLSTRLAAAQPRYQSVLNNRRMNQRFWNGILATLLAPGIGMACTIHAAEATPRVNQDSQIQQPSQQQVQKSATAAPASSTPNQPSEVLKVGEYQLAAEIETDQPVMAKILAHEFQGRQAATLYVRSIPILTFLGARSPASGDTKMGEVVGSENSSSRQRGNMAAQQAGVSQRRDDGNKPEEDPVVRASAVAARLNQLNRDKLDARSISVSWNAGCKCYAIKVKDEDLVQLDSKTILADTTRNLAADALQATNRLRRLMGNAPPLRAIAGMPVKKPDLISLAKTVLYEIRGIASWYGYDSGTASGEPFRPNGLTAAHRSLPFGTKVRVINLNNGRSVIVRINDRGPFIRGRVIDLSTGAARALGMLGSGLAPVRVEVLGTQPQPIFAQQE